MHVFTDVPTWLKSLRLHKYAYLFQQMTYEEMLTVSEDWLETQVTPHTVQFTVFIAMGSWVIKRSETKKFTEGRN